ncbi:MAG: hypothetical protein KIT11_01845 [Fimbriimonadaceae bacterium]|nr:hypothetical protein [Fimbriimonadaceae bacterium]QYK54886.1 MAG: hypothetical protein KF733_07690 [Fimbriimonadaceae bacterium]
MGRALDTRSGPWAGFWIQGTVRGTMRLTLRFKGGLIAGDGEDRSGSFAMRGTYDPDGKVEIAKLYDLASIVGNWACPKLEYIGTWDGTLISGLWEDASQPLNCGEFEIWPEVEETAIAHVLESEASLESLSAR